MGLSPEEEGILTQNQGATPHFADVNITFERLNLPKLCKYLDHAIIETDDQHSKINLRFVGVPQAKVMGLSKLLWKMVNSTGVPDSEALFDESPMIAMTHDFVQFFIPNITVKSVHRYMLGELTREYA